MSRELVSISGVHWLMAGGGGTSGASSVLLDEKLHGRRAARNRMIEQNLPLARAIARRFPNGPEPVEDLVQDASIGLIRAVDGFRAERGRDLGPYAVPTFVGELRRSVRRRSWPVRVPSGRLDIEPRPVAVTLDEDLEAPGAEAELERSEERLLLHAGIRTLSRRERRAIVLRFYRDWSQERIAEELGVSQPQVSRILASALRALRAELVHARPEAEHCETRHTRLR
jgi:RNA polymerase sigma-B factor